MVKYEVESQQVQQPSGLALIELLSDSKILKVLVVGPDLYRVVSFFKVMSPLFKPSDDGKHLGIMDLVVLLDWIECFQQEGNWCQALSSHDCWERTAPVTMPEPSASSQNGRSSLGSTSTGDEVMSFLSFMKESSWGRPQMNLTSFMVRSNSV
jgi:hypothetical protein